MSDSATVMTVDTSAILAVLLGEPTRDTLVRTTDGCSLVAAPSLPWEVGNALIAGMRRRKLSLAQVKRAWASYESIPVRLVAIDVGASLALSSSLGLYAYDGYVLQAAIEGRAPLLTLDSTMERAARSAGVIVVEFEP